jgi:hypothetical protein
LIEIAIIKDLQLELAAVQLELAAAEVDGPAVYTWMDA